MAGESLNFLSSRGARMSGQTADDGTIVQNVNLVTPVDVNVTAKLRPADIFAGLAALPVKSPDLETIARQSAELAYLKSCETAMATMLHNERYGARGWPMPC